MANNYVQGTITPSIPLTDVQCEALGLDVADVQVDNPEGHCGKCGEVGHGSAMHAPEAQAELLRLRWHARHHTDERTSGLTYEQDGKTVLGEDGKLSFQPNGLYYLYAEDGLSEGFDAVLQEILQGLPEEQYSYLVYEYAASCSKMRQGEFGGGACLITRDDIQWISTGYWLSQRKQELKNPPPPPKVLSHLECVLEVVKYADVSITVECTEHGEVVETLWERGAENDE